MKHFTYEKNAREVLKKHQLELLVTSFIFIPMFIAMGIGSGGGIGLYISIFSLICCCIGIVFWGSYTIKALKTSKSEKWVVEINDQLISWEAPNSLNLENSFKVYLSDINHILNSVSDFGESETHSYKLVLNNDSTIALSQYSGIPILEFIKTLNKLGVPSQIQKI